MKKLEEINILLNKLKELTGNADFENAENLENLERGTMTAGAATAHKEEN